MNIKKIQFIGALCALFCATFTAQASPPTALVAWGTEHIPALPAETKFKAISSGAYHNLAIRSDDTVVAWGADHDGQCRVPTGLTDVVAVAAGGSYSLALKSDGTVVGWGFNSNGALNIPPGLTNVVAIAAGRFHTLALKSDGTVVSWSHGASPVPEGLSNVVAIAAGQYRSLALNADGTVLTWGNTITPTTIASNIVAITHSLGLKNDGSVVVFYGPVPWEPPIRLTGVVAIASSIDETGANQRHATLTEDGVVSTWLLQPNGELDNGGVYDELNDISDIAVGPHHNLFLKTDGSLFAFGRSDYSQSVVPTAFNDIIAVAAGKRHQLVARKDGTIFAWGDNHGGQLHIPNSISNAVAVAAGANHTAVLKADGRVGIWGDWGRIADTDFIMSNVTNAVAIAAGDDHGLVLDGNGKIWAWGTNSFGQRDIPLGLSNVVAIAAGEAHSVALRADGTAIVWGKISQDFTNYNDIVAVEASMLLRADGTTVHFGRGENHMPPVSNTIAISSGRTYELALTWDAKVIIGGINYNGRPNTYISPEVKRVLAIEAGWGKSFAIVSIAPELRSQMSGGNLMLSWPVSTKNYILQTTSDVTAVDSWAEVAGDVVVENHRNTFTLPASGEQRYFRLVRVED